MNPSKIRPLLVGAGGIASYFLPAFIRTFPDIQAGVLYDGDLLEARNMDRQLFGPNQVGKNKAEALLRHNRIHPSKIAPRCEYITPDILNLEETFDLIIVMVDNHPSRRDCIHLAEKKRIPIFIGANETWSANAFCWNPLFPKEAHPFAIHPEIETDESDRPTLSCQATEATNAAPQLALGNMLAATYLLQLIYTHLLFQESDEEITLPLEHWNTLTTIQSSHVKA